uniref:ascorbate ferrireductase (transmembrane) n=1 Tax=Ditylenchus dipsaci TaxID=166011 RepID=A0A915E3R0_9BILA
MHTTINKTFSAFNFSFIIHLICLLFTCVWADKFADSISDCGVSKGCWLMPPGCQDHSEAVCTGIFSWVTNPNGFSFNLVSYLGDLKSSADIAYYGAVGFSLDEFMGDDTVIVCTVDNTGYGTVLLGWNDHTKNYLQFQATEVILTSTTASLVNDRIDCEGKFNFAGWKKVERPNRVYDFQNGNQSYHLLFARGRADPRTHELRMHQIWDGDRFPWVSTETMQFCLSSGCGGTGTMPWLNTMHQSSIPRRIRHNIAAAHGIIMTLSTFVLISTGILMARFGKAYHANVYGMAFWFQVHRFCMFTALIGMTVSIFFIFYQAHFKLFNCSTLCSIEDYQKQMHAIIGTFIYILIIAQAVSGILRPALSSDYRTIWNWFHAVNGLFIFVGSATCCVLALPLGKVGLDIFYNKMPNYVMMVTIITFIVSFVVCEWFVHGQRFVTLDPDRVQKLQAELDENGDDENDEKDWKPAVLIAFNLLTGLAAFGIICTMLLQAMKAFSFM